MKVRNPFGEDRYVFALGREVPAGGVVDVPDELGVQLVEAGWHQVRSERKGER